MKPAIVALSVCLMLCGCAEEQPPETEFTADRIERLSIDTQTTMLEITITDSSTGETAKIVMPPRAAITLHQQMGQMFRAILRSSSEQLDRHEETRSSAQPL